MRWNRLRTTSLAATVSIVAVCACSFIVETENTNCKTTADCINRGSAFAGLVCGPQGVCVSEGGCKTNAECIDANGGVPFLCNKATKACVKLQTDLATSGAPPAPCTPYAEPADLRNDDTIWLGSVIDTKGPFGAQGGTQYVNFMELARREISKATNGLPPAVVGGKSRPLAFVHCESNGDPIQAVNAANYLVKDAGIQVFIAGDNATTGVPMAQQVFIPNKILDFALQAGGAADLPSGNPPLFYPMQGSIYASAQWTIGGLAAAEVVARERLSIPSSEDIRVAFVSSDGQVFRAFADALPPLLRFNNKTALENGANFKRFQYGESASPGELASIQADVVAFNPHVIVGNGFGEFSNSILGAVDRQLTAGGNPGPNWLLGQLSVSPALFEEGSARPGLQSRLLWIGIDLATPDVQAKAQDYAAAFPGSPPLDVVLSGYLTVPYDLFYLSAYAIAANGASPVTGENLAKVLPKVFNRTARHILTGSTDLFNGYAAFSAGGAGSIFLKGRQAFRNGEDHVDLDLEKGYHPYWPASLYCPLNNAAGIVATLPPQAMISGQPSGISFRYPDIAVQGRLLPACVAGVSGG